ncbi:hypothetical protein KY285_003778 [Solanum tuberosum]|nr:hypothetical protein KY289_001025 [Solanum tuberosum]KAH0767907.1 hypothetical protein KY285_003778 [Solanum tuberosum]
MPRRARRGSSIGGREAQRGSSIGVGEARIGSSIGGGRHGDARASEGGRGSLWGGVCRVAPPGWCAGRGAS